MKILSRKRPTPESFCNQAGGSEADAEMLVHRRIHVTIERETVSVLAGSRQDDGTAETAAETPEPASVLAQLDAEPPSPAADHQHYPPATARVNRREPAGEEKSALCMYLEEL